MRVLLVGDFRSALARGWVDALPATVDEVVLLSTRAAPPIAGPRVLELWCSSEPISKAKNFLAANRRRAAGIVPTIGTPQARSLPRIALEVVAARSVAKQAEQLLKKYQPDVVHGLRIPFEGIAASMATRARKTVLALSIWGNDLTLHASRSRWVGRLTREALGQTAALHTDCKRDAVLAKAWGFREEAPVLVVPTNGGLDSDVFSPGAPDWARLRSLGVEPDRPIVVNPRGLRAYVRTDVFLRAIDVVRRDVPDVLAVVVGVAGHAPSQRLLDELGLGSNMLLLPGVSQATLADIFRAAAVSVSPATHDGTPNSLLEAMACGALPVVSDLPSTREWVEHRANGLLFDPGNAEGLAEQIVHALGEDRFRRAACEQNARTVETEATRASCAARIAAWYEAMLGAPQPEPPSRSSV